MMIRKANPADKWCVTGVLTKSFADNLSVQFITGGRPDRMAALMDYSFELCRLFGEVWVSEDLSACALVLYPEQKRTTLKSMLLDLRLVLKGMALNKLLKIIRRESAVKALHPEGRKAYLWFIGVLPAEQHRGLGSALLREVIRRSEADERLVLLETSTLRNIPWYKSFGFSTYATLDLGYKLFFLKKGFAVA